MKGSNKVIAILKELLAGELAARDQYFIHSRMYEDWGLSKLYERIHHEMQEETDHADAMIKRILFFEETPDLNKQEQINIGSDVVSMLKSDLALEYKVADDLKAAIKICEEERDFVSRDMLLLQLKDTEEDHAYWLEQQLGLIDKIGLQNYLQSQS
ncbi:bacterioferritin [Cocleimonas sp. KMM 6892]|jgi:bacterioferritin|uniref:bacterioferritin n=1 Tax=unclassified Cocleimonas TaxID=2639732 RepID=UPI002DBAC88F|nr:MULTISPECIES: bacterioferritin [unclassified Cocleimonas]MEB8432733.1 bacterioferritin [Cocleimonas sp. KMM 6892]MEC4715592.1 bacterioferritin [Cocleimonas sp. KMM 6895]MEC4744790.1 bacterioferritin [Cocleimonas sp. KMM 6896]